MQNFAMSGKDGMGRWSSSSWFTMLALFLLNSKYNLSLIYLGRNFCSTFYRRTFCRPFVCLCLCKGAWGRRGRGQFKIMQAFIRCLRERSCTRLLQFELYLDLFIWMNLKMTEAEIKQGILCEPCVNDKVRKTSSLWWVASFGTTLFAN